MDTSAITTHFENHLTIEEKQDVVLASKTADALESLHLTWLDVVQSLSSVLTLEDNGLRLRSVRYFAAVIESAPTSTISEQASALHTSHQSLIERS